MSQFTLVDIQDLTESFSKDEGMFYAVAVPVGAGAFVLRKLSKENLFKLQGQDINFATVAGENDIISFDGAPDLNKVVYSNNGSTGVLRLKVGAAGVSANGTSNAVEMTAEGELRAGGATLDANFRLWEDGEAFDYSARDLEQNIVLDVAAVTGATTTAAVVRQSIVYLEVAGTIATHEVVFPSPAKIGYTFEFVVTGTITAITMEAGIATVRDPLTTATNEGAKWVRVLLGADPTWIRMYRF